MTSPSTALKFSLTLAVAVIAGLSLAANRRTMPNRVDDSTGRDPRPAPEWTNTSWLNAGAPVTLRSLRGRVVLLNFWTFTCGNCTRTIPALVALDRTYRDRGLTLIGIHTPEFPPYAGEHNRANVARALERHQIEYANAQDNDAATWTRYRIRYWPSYVLIDKQGRIRAEGYGEFHAGDAEHRRWAERVELLLAE